MADKKTITEIPDHVVESFLHDVYFRRYGSILIARKGKESLRNGRRKRVMNGW